MLVLTFVPGESVMIGDDIEVVVHRLEAGQVKLGFTAPRDLTILRTKLWQQRQRQRRAGESAPSPPRVHGRFG